MKKIFALALAAGLFLSVSPAALAAATPAPDVTLVVDSIVDYQDINGKTVTNEYNNNGEAIAPGSTVEIDFGAPELDGWRISGTDFTTQRFSGSGMIESVAITKEKDAIRITLKERFFLAEAEDRAVAGNITLKKSGEPDKIFFVSFGVNNQIRGITGAGRAANATQLVKDADYGKNIVTVMDEEGGYVTFSEGGLTGTVKMNQNEKACLNIAGPDDDTKDALKEYMGEDYGSVIDFYQFETRAFKNTVDFAYDAYQYDPCFFYLWDGAKLSPLEAGYDDDADVNAYVWTCAADGLLVVTDTEIVAAEEEYIKKNPDTGAHDLAGAAAALAALSLAAGAAVSLKK